MQSSLSRYPYKGKRNVMTAKNGMVATSQPFAAEAGADILKQGGNAIDAAIATAAALTVVEPTSNGIGGDAFAIISFEGNLHGLNGSGKSPKALTFETLKKQGHKTMPKFGVLPITTPGAVSAWVAMSEKFGALDFETVLTPAIRLARNGFPLSPTVAESWANAMRGYQKVLKDDVYKPLFDTFTKDGHVPDAGGMFYLEDHADTLESIAKTKGKSFYKGQIAKKITDYIQAHGGVLSMDDLANHEPLWVDPISVNYRGYDVHELPPNTQGLIALEGLEILKRFSFSDYYESLHLHRQIEATKLAFTDGLSHIADPDHLRTRVDALLSESNIQKHYSSIDDKAHLPKPSDTNTSGTVYLATGDKDGNMVSFIQSNYMGFGSGVVIPGTGIAMQNRGHNFSMDKDHPNCIGGAKRTYHTIIPGFLSKDGRPLGPFGVMGGFMQPQGHIQVVMSLIDDQLNPQAALDRPRWQWMEGKRIKVEKEMPSHIIETLKRYGHIIEIEHNVGLFGRGQIILRTDEGVYLGGTEKRCDGHIALY